MDVNAYAEFWDGMAEKYAAKPVDDVPAWERKQAFTKSHLRPDATILDVGCGTGSLALILAPGCRHVHAIDVSAEMVRIAEAKKAAAGIDNVTFHRGTLDGPTPFEPGQLDGVCAYSILHLVPDRHRTLRTMYELLKPGGWLISSTVCLGGSLVPYRPILWVMRLVGKAPKVTILSQEEIVGDIRDAGFEDVELVDVGSKEPVAFAFARKPDRAQRAR